MNNDPFISIVIPTYNRAHLIVKTLNSLLQQDYAHYEVIVVDDGSTDNTEEVVKAINDERLSYYKKENAERAAARNYGAQHAKGDYVNFFDSDDIALPHHLTEAVKMIQKYNMPEWFHLAYAWAKPDGIIFKKFESYNNPTSNHLLINGNPVGTNSVFIRKDIILKNSFNEDRTLSASEDIELWFRLAARFPMYSSNAITSHLIDHDSRSVRTTNAEALILRMSALLKYLSQDDHVMQSYGDKWGRLKMDAESYVALHLSDSTQHKTTALLALWSAFIASPYLLMRKRFYATLRNLFFNWCC